MQYLLPKRRFLPILLTGAFIAAAISFYILARLDAVGALLMPYIAAFCIAASLYTVGRFLVFGTLYRLSDDYADFTFTVFRVYQKTSTPIATVDLTGNEALILLNKAGKKKLRKKKKLGVYTANLIPKDYYALTCALDGKEGYILLELDTAAKEAIEARIARAKRILSLDEKPEETL